MEEFLTEKPTIDSAAKNLLSFILGTAQTALKQDENNKMDRLLTQKVLGSLLRNVNSFSAVSEISVVAKIAEHAKSISSRPTKVAGKSFLKLLWKEVEPLVVAECKAKDVNEDVTKDVLSLMRRATFDEDKSDISKLIWAEDFNAILRERQRKLKEEAIKRVEEAKEADKPQITEITEEE